MATMGSYCKAYPAEHFAEYAGWRERRDWLPEPEAEPGASAEEAETRYLFLQENFVVTDGIFLDERIVFDDVTDEWKSFCRETLQFEVPTIDDSVPLEALIASPS